MSMNYNASKRDYGKILRDALMVEAMKAHAEVIASRARAIAPRDTGEYIDKIRVSTTRRGGIRGDRAAGVVTAGAPHSAAVEFGNSRTRGHHVLRRAAQQ